MLPYIVHKKSSFVLDRSPSIGTITPHTSGCPPGGNFSTKLKSARSKPGKYELQYMQLTHKDSINESPLRSKLFSKPQMLAQNKLRLQMSSDSAGSPQNNTNSSSNSQKNNNYNEPAYFLNPNPLASNLVSLKPTQSRCASPVERTKLQVGGTQFLEETYEGSIKKFTRRKSCEGRGAFGEICASITIREKEYPLTLINMHVKRLIAEATRKRREAEIKATRIPNRKLCSYGTREYGQNNKFTNLSSTSATSAAVASLSGGNAGTGTSSMSSPNQPSGMMKSCILKSLFNTQHSQILSSQPSMDFGNAAAASARVAGQTSKSSLLETPRSNSISVPTPAGAVPPKEESVSLFSNQPKRSFRLSNQEAIISIPITSSLLPVVTANTTTANQQQKPTIAGSFSNKLEEQSQFLKSPSMIITKVPDIYLEGEDEEGNEDSDKETVIAGATSGIGLISNMDQSFEIPNSTKPAQPVPRVSQLPLLQLSEIDENFQQESDKFPDQQQTSNVHSPLQSSSQSSVADFRKSGGMNASNRMQQIMIGESRNAGFMQGSMTPGQRQTESILGFEDSRPLCSSVKVIAPPLNLSFGQHYSIQQQQQSSLNSPRVSHSHRSQMPDATPKRSKVGGSGGGGIFTPRNGSEEKKKPFQNLQENTKIQEILSEYLQPGSTEEAKYSPDDPVQRQKNMRKMFISATNMITLQNKVKANNTFYRQYYNLVGKIGLDDNMQYLSQIADEVLATPSSRNRDHIIAAPQKRKVYIHTSSDSSVKLVCSLNKLKLNKQVQRYVGNKSYYTETATTENFEMISKQENTAMSCPPPKKHTEESNKTSTHQMSLQKYKETKKSMMNSRSYYSTLFPSENKKFEPVTKRNHSNPFTYQNICKDGSGPYQSQLVKHDSSLQEKKSRSRLSKLPPLSFTTPTAQNHSHS